MHSRLLQYGPVYSNGNIQKPAPRWSHPHHNQSPWSTICYWDDDAAADDDEDAGYWQWRKTVPPAVAISVSLTLVFSFNSLNFSCSRLPQTNRTERSVPTSPQYWQRARSDNRQRPVADTQISLRRNVRSCAILCVTLTLHWLPLCCCYRCTDCDGRFSPICDSN